MSDTELYTLNYAGQSIIFERAKRKSSSNKILVKVHPDCRVTVSAPDGVDKDAILRAVTKRGRWIYKQLHDFRKQIEYISPRQYISGESHYYLGKQYLLKVVEAPNQVQGVKLLRGKLEVSVRTRSPKKIKELLTEWYKGRAREIFAKRLSAMLEETLWVEEKPSLHILTMKTQWGSCSPNGRITLNPHLVKAPRECIDYVILHELCHIDEHNHSKKFYRLMNQVMPGWERIKQRLDGMAKNYIDS